MYLGVVRWFQTLSLVGSNPSSGQQGALTWSRWACVCHQDPQLKGRRQSRSQQYWEIRVRTLGAYEPQSPPVLSSARLSPKAWLPHHLCS